jgi:hypothetical protein
MSSDEVSDDNIDVDEATELGDGSGVYIPTEGDAEDEYVDFNIDFGSFVLSVATSCKVHLGLEEMPETGQTIKDLAAAKHNIEILQLLSEKTEGNLDPEERELLDQVLYEVKMAYVDEAQ